MEKRDYFNQVLHELEPKYHAINLTFTLVLYFAGNSYLFQDGFLLSALIDITAAILGTGIHIFRNRFKLQNKMIMTVMVLFIFSAQSLARGGFAGNGLIGLALIIIISIIFLDRRAALTISLLTVGLLAVLTILAYNGIFDLHSLDISRYMAPVEWLYQTVSLGMFVVVTYLSIYSIRKMLLSSIEQLSELAYKDDLTQLNNRNYFLDKLPVESASEINKNAIIAILDILNFRLINSLYGVEKGDQLLKNIARIATENTTRQISLSRISSNEFALFVIGWNTEDLAGYLRKCTEQLVSSTGELGVISKQRFIVAYKPFIFTSEAYKKAFRDVSIALKYAKEHELQGLIQFDDSMFKGYEESEKIRSKIEHALISDEFQVHFQGKWHVAEQRFCGYEALARWNSPDGAISPGVFIPLINKSNYMTEFSRMIIKKALADFEAIHLVSGHVMTVSLNITPLFFLKSGFEKYIVEAIGQTRLDPSQIILEITEDVFINDYDEINQKIISLKKSGIRVSLDDFGSGYSSLNHLNNIDLDELKVDKSIIDGILDNPKSKILYQMLVSLARKMGCTLVAEGVERIEQYNCLVEMGCDSIQGYYFSRPQSALDIIASLQRDISNKPING